MPESRVDLDAYLGRIGYSQDRSPTLATLERLQSGHAQAIAFENLASFLGEKVELDPASVQDKLVTQGRGGYCYEQNLLFWQVLSTMGFEVSGLAARVRWNIPEHVVVPRTHMLLLVELGAAEYIADVGFGGLTPTGPLRLEADIEQSTPHEVFRLVHHEGLYTVEAECAGRWKALYSFDLQGQYAEDYELANWYHSTCPQSPFVQDLTVARAAPGRRHALLNDRYTVYHPEGEAEERTMKDADDLMETLQAVFGLALPDDPDFENRLWTLVAARRTNGGVA